MTIEFKLGADPELFLKRADGTNISAHDIVPGSKKAPHIVDSGAIQPDGLAAEFNIDAVPFNDFRAFDNNLTKVLGELKKTVGPDVFFDTRPSTLFDKDYYDSLPETAKILGCDPDYDAYSEDPMKPNPRPDGSSGLRSAAGHLHIGWGNDIPVDHPEHLDICRDFIRQLDLYVGLGMTVFDTDTERRKLYGKAGAYRPKHYGVEYRTPSNAWISSRVRRQFIHNLVVAAITDMQSGSPKFSTFEKRYAKTYGSVQDIINNGDAAKAEMILTAILGVHIPSGLKAPTQKEIAVKAETAAAAVKVVKKAKMPAAPTAY